MTIQKELSRLTKAMKEAGDDAIQANAEFLRAKERLHAMERFANDTKPISEICVVNSDSCYGVSRAILTRHYILEGFNVLFTATEAEDDGWVCHIIDYNEKTVMYACYFHLYNLEEREELFEKILTAYADWRFEL